ncbi:MAG: WD40/YVTN/BNR-like repeat-containing protein [Tepidisphaeraceae bacterium]
MIDPSPANRDDTSAPYAAASRVHWMGDVEIDPFDSNVAMFVTGYGLYRTTNLLDATPKWTFFNDGFEQSAALELASPTGGPVHLLSAIGDRDGYRHVDFDESPKAGVLGEQNGLAMGSNMDIDVAAKDPNQVVRLGHVKSRVQYSTDNGVNWAWFPAAQTGDSDRGRDNLAISADGTRTAYQPAGDARVVVSTRHGSTWSDWKAPSNGRPAAGAVLVADLEAPHTFYAFNGETVSRSTDGGDSWSPMTDLAPHMTWVRAVPAHVGHLVGSAGGRGAWRSIDGGKTWSRLAPQALSVANVIGVGAGETSSAYPAIFVGGSCMGQTGFFRSDDQGQSWTRISDADHQYGWVTVIQGDPRVYGRLYVGTNGRGILYGDIAGH